MPVNFSYKLHDQSERDFYDSLWAQMQTERASFEAHWMDLADFVRPVKRRFQTSDTNRGERKNERIIDSTATLALRTLQSGLMAGLTSPARPWFRLQIRDFQISEMQEVKDWLSQVVDILRNVFNRALLYKSLNMAYGEMGLFGTSCILVEEDFKKVMKFHSIPIGSYYLSNDKNNNPRIFAREFRLTVRQVVDKFGREPGRKEINWENISEGVRFMYENGQRESWVDIKHFIVPNDDYDPRKFEAKFKAYKSIYYEEGFISTSRHTPQWAAAGNPSNRDKYLKQSGYDLFPLLVYRWDTTGEDIYATDCPGMTALGDIKALQLLRKEGLMAVEKMVNPALVASPSLRQSKITLLPGDVQYVQELNGRPGLRPVHEVNPQILALREEVLDTRQLISRSFYEDLFLMLARSDRREITAREIDERHEEKLLALGPVLENVNEQNDHLIDLAFHFALKQRLIPPPPEVLQGMELDVEYISIMAQAQKLISTGGIERFALFAGQQAQINPEVLDKIDTDQMIDEYGEALSVPVGILRDDREVAAIRQQRQQAIQAQQMAQMAQQGASAAKDLSKAETGEGENLLSQLIGGAQPTV